MLFRSLGGYGIQVDTCLSGREAIERCGRVPYDVVFLDHMMPGFDGVETLKRTTMEDGRHFASLRRWLMYGESSATRDVYIYAADASNRYGRLGDCLLVVSPNTAQMCLDDGTILYDLSLNMASPQVSAGSRLASVCDAGGDTLYVLDRNGVRRTMKTERGLCYYAARLNEGDYLAVTEQKGGYKASVSVYDADGEIVFHFDSYDSYISDAVVTPDCRSVVM